MSERKIVTAGDILSQLQAIVDEHGPDAEVAVNTYAEPGRLWLFGEIGFVYHTDTIVECEEGYCRYYEDEDSCREQEGDEDIEVKTIKREIIVFTTSM